MLVELSSLKGLFSVNVEGRGSCWLVLRPRQRLRDAIGASLTPFVEAMPDLVRP